MTVTDLLEQPCNKSDNAIKLVPNLLQQLRTNSANTTYRYLLRLYRAHRQNHTYYPNHSSIINIQ
jgi:hypothetical protein